MRISWSQSELMDVCQPISPHNKTTNCDEIVYSHPYPTIHQHWTVAIMADINQERTARLKPRNGMMWSDRKGIAWDAQRLARKHENTTLEQVKLGYRFYHLHCWPDSERILCRLVSAQSMDPCCFIVLTSVRTTGLPLFRIRFSYGFHNSGMGRFSASSPSCPSKSAIQALAGSATTSSRGINTLYPRGILSVMTQARQTVYDPAHI